jgi:uncharacterized protein (DUF2236 family)
MTAPTATAAGATQSVSRTIHAERVLLLGWGRALLLQFAHPLVAQGIVDHSGFLRSRRGRWGRLRRTLDAMLILTYGTPEQAAAVADGINAIHDRVNGHAVLPPPAQSATPYSAHDPALLAWVHATLLDSFLLAYELYVAPLSAADKDRYCAESAGIEPMLGIPDGHLPRSTRALAAYMDGMLTGGELVVTDGARRLAAELFRPVPRIAAPLMWLARLPSVGLLPARIRQDYGYAWSPGRETAFRISVRVIRVMLRITPGRLRYWPPARRRRDTG